MQDAPSIVLASEPAFRLAAFAGTFAVMAGWELFAPRRSSAVSRWVRWPSNLGIAALNTLVVRVLFPTAAVGFAMIAEERGWGLLNILDLPGWLKALIAILLLDLVIYAQHVAFHSVPWLWRLHRLHHADLEVDVTTGVRFHPLEILISMAVKIAAVVALGAPALGVVLFEVLLNATSMFNHSNARIPAKIDSLLRLFVVTPDMHRIHHSILRDETNSNFGFQVPWWDRLFGTYVAEPSAGYGGMTVGIELFRDPAQLRLDRLLIQPFV